MKGVRPVATRIGIKLRPSTGENVVSSDVRQALMRMEYEYEFTK